MRLVKIFTNWIVEWVIIGIIVIILFAVTFSCSDDTTIISTSQKHQIHQNHGKGHNKDCQAVIDSLEAELEECRND